MAKVAAAWPETECMILRPYTYMKTMLLASPSVAVHDNKKASGSGKFRGRR